MSNWFSYFLTMMMALLLVVGGSVCGCAHAHAMGAGGHEAVSESQTGGERTRCGCLQDSASDEESENYCQCGCEEIAEHERENTESVAAAVVAHNELDGFELPVLQPRFKALFAVWFADFLEPLWARESGVVAEFIDPGPPGVDVPIYLKNQNLRL